MNNLLLLLTSMLLVTCTTSPPPPALDARKQPAEEGARKEQPAAPSVTDLVQPFSLDQYIDRQPDRQIGEYVREVFLDSRGDLWFGTLGYGVARYDAESLTYFGREQGLVGNQINGIAEDAAGRLWFSSTAGVSVFDGTSFTSYGIQEGLPDTSTWCIAVDRKDRVWVGTMGGVARFDGRRFQAFPLPKPKLAKPTHVFSGELVWDIMEDRAGNLWFGTDGFGAIRYDGSDFTHFTTHDGLKGNVIYDLLADSRGGIWLGSRAARVAAEDNPHFFVDDDGAGLTYYDGTDFRRFPEIEGFNGHLIAPIYEDRAGDIWIASMHRGVYRYDGREFVRFSETGGYTNNCIQSITEDREGRLWFGFSGGLFRLEGDRFVNVTKDGPW